MATQTAGNSTEQNRIRDDSFFENDDKQERMEERQETVLFKFDKPGVILEGHVAGFLRTIIAGKPGVDIYFALNGKSDKFVKIHATRQMLEKIRTTDSGKKARITYMGESDIQTVGNKMKLYKIQVNTRMEPRTDLLMDTSLLEMLQDES